MVKSNEELDDFCLVELLFGAWKNVGMTMTCNRCDVMNITTQMAHKTQMAQKMLAF